MKKSRLLMLLSVLLLSLAMVGIAIAADNYQSPQPVAFTGLPPAGAPDNVLNSRVDYMAPEAFSASGETVDIYFHVVAESSDLEYMDGLEINLPDDWTVNTVYDVPGTGCGIGHTFGVDPGNEVYWMTIGGPGTGCGDWVPGLYDFGVNVTVPAGCSSPWEIPWDYFGDTWGSPPHTNEGTIMALCAVPGLYLLPETQDVMGCNGIAQEHTLTLINFTGAAGTFDMTYTITDGVGTLTGPATVDAEEGESVDFTVTLTPETCGVVGDTLTAMVGAEGNSYSDTSIINKTIGAEPEWDALAGSKPSWGGSGYPRDGCTALNAADEWVTYELGDMSGISGFWGYNHGTNTWALVGATNTPADRWAPDWAYDADENLCYLTGGASAPGGGTYNAAYVFDPVANSFTQLGSFTSVRDFHTSWVGTIDGVKYLCLGGGVNASSILVRSTQCFDLSQAAPGVWNAENAQMPQLLNDPFGAADGVMHTAEGDLFIYSGGAVNNFATVTDEVYYFSDADNSWHLAGNSGVAAYRVEGEVLDDEYYQAGGSSGGFTPITLVVKGSFEGGVWTFTPVVSMNNQRMDNIVAVADGMLWSVDGYGSTAANFVEKLSGSCVSCSEVPVITVDPMELTASLAPDETITKQLNVCNIGGLPLSWELYEAEAPMAASALNSRTPEALVPPVGSWLQLAAADIASANDAPLSVPAYSVPLLPYVAPEDVLYDNGPLVTHPGGGFNGADASALQSNLSMNTYGFGFQLLYGYRMADDFTVDDASGWDIDQFTFYGYQTGSPTDPSSFTGIYYQIWDGPPDNPASTIVYGDLVTNRLVSSTWTNIYRVLDTALTANNRPIMDLVADAGFHLAQGTYWIDFMADGSLASGPWAPPVTILGQTTTGNGMQYTTGWAPALDTGTATQQDLPFLIEGLSEPFDLLWLSETPITGTVPINECMMVDVTFDSAGLAIGTYTGQLVFENNSFFTPEVVVPVTLIVGEAAPALEVVPDTVEVELMPGGTTTVDVSLNNTGNTHIDWDATETAPWLTLDPTTGTLLVEGSDTITLSFDATGLTGGDHLADVIFAGGGAEATLSVNLKVLTFNFFIPFIHK